MSPLPPSPLPARPAATGRQPVRAGGSGFCSSPAVWQHGPVVRDLAFPAKGTACLWRRFRAAGAGERCPQPHFVFFIRRSSFRIHSVELAKVTPSLPRRGKQPRGACPPDPRLWIIFSQRSVPVLLHGASFETGGDRPWPHRNSILNFLTAFRHFLEIVYPRPGLCSRCAPVFKIVCSISVKLKNPLQVVVRDLLEFPNLAVNPVLDE